MIRLLVEHGDVLKAPLRQMDRGAQTKDARADNDDRRIFVCEEGLGRHCDRTSSAIATNVFSWVTTTLSR